MEGLGSEGWLRRSGGPPHEPQLSSCLCLHDTFLRSLRTAAVSLNVPDSPWPIPGRPHSLGVCCVFRGTVAAVSLGGASLRLNRDAQSQEQGGQPSRWVLTLALLSVVGTTCLPPCPFTWGCRSWAAPSSPSDASP